jgi:hypothetical protein
MELVKDLLSWENPHPLLGMAFVNPVKLQLKVKKAGGKQAKHRLYAWFKSRGCILKLA